jgi:hypothetical protein
VQKFICPECQSEEVVFAALESVPFAAAKCAKDGQLRAVVTVHSYSGREDFGPRPLSQLGLPPFDVFIARTSAEEIAYIPYGDAPNVLGPLAPEQTVS